MNRIYKVIWSKVKHCYVVASELVKSNGKGSGRRTLTEVDGGVRATAAAGHSFGYHNLYRRCAAVMALGVPLWHRR